MAVNECSSGNQPARWESSHSHSQICLTINIYLANVNLETKNGLSGKPHSNKHLMTSTLISFLKRYYRSKSAHIFLSTWMADTNCQSTMLAARTGASGSFLSTMISPNSYQGNASIFALTDVSSDTDLTYDLKSKALNICANMAMSSSAEIHEMLEPKYGVLPQVQRVLAQPRTYDLLENSLWLVANISGDSAKMCKKIIKGTNLLETLSIFSQIDVMTQCDRALADEMTWLI